MGDGLGKWEMTSNLRQVSDIIYIYPIVLGAHAKSIEWACWLLSEHELEKHDKIA